MPAEIINNVTSIKYEDDLAVIKLLLTDSDGTAYPLDGKTIVARFRNDKTFLMQKDVTEIEDGYVILRVTKEDSRNLYVGAIYIEIAVYDSTGSTRIFPEKGFIEINIDANASVIVNKEVSLISLEYFTEKFTEKESELEEKFTQEAQRVEEIAVKAIIPEEGITKPLIAPGAVDETKTTLFTRYGLNLFNKATAIQGKYVEGTSGFIKDSANYYAYFTEAGDINPGDYVSKPDTLPHYAWYDADGNYLSGGNTTISGQNLIQAPPNTAVLGVSIPVGNVNGYMLNIGQTLQPYQEYGYKFANEQTIINTLNDTEKSLDAKVLTDQSVDDDKVKDESLTLDKLAFTEPGINLYDDSKAVDAALNITTGDTQASSTQRTSTFMPAAAKDIFNWNFNISKYVLYDANFDRITGSQPSPAIKTLTLPDNSSIAWIRVDFYRPNAATFMTVRNQGIPTVYTPASRQIKKDALPSFDDDFLLFLPSEIYIAVGRTIELYNKQVSWTGNPNNYHFQWICDVGSALKRKWSCKATDAMLGNHTLTCNVHDNNMKLVATATTTIKVVTNVVSSDLKILPIGDSLTNNKGWLQEVINLSNGKITFVGTRWNGDIQGGQRNHEGRSGATAAFYLGNNVYSFDSNGATDRNPFYNPTTGKFDYQYYKDTYGISPDGIQLFLGTNGIQSDPTANANNIKAIVDGIRAVDATIPIFVVFTLYRGDQNGMGKQLSSDGYSAGSGVWKLQEDRKVFNLMVQNYKLLNGYTNLKFIPISLTHDSEYNFRDTVQTPVNPRSTITELQDAEATHPSKIPAGYLQMADSEFSTYQGAYS